VFLDIGPGEFLVIAVVGLLIVGPERLPKMFAEAVRWLRYIREQAAGARREIVAAADIDPTLTDELRRSVNDLAELHPKRLMGSLLDDTVAAQTPEVPPVPPSVTAPVNSFGASATSNSFAPRPADAPPAAAPSPAAFDPDAT
jgi:sec-independent protein translocase protein TatB